MIDGKIEIRPMLSVVWNVDHWYVDGAMAVSFLKQIKQMVEDPITMEGMKFEGNELVSKKDKLE